MRNALVLAVLLVASSALAQGDMSNLSRPATSDESSESVLKRARALYDGLEYDKVGPLAEAVLAREDVPIDQRLDAYLLQGSSMAIVGDPIEAEKPFRLLLRARPDFDMPASTPPKILAVFRKVQAEENTIREEARKALRDKIVQDMAILGEDPEEHEGGLPLRFSYRVRDPNAAATGARVLYKKQKDTAFSSLALERDEEGAWRGAIPGEWTANEDGFQLVYYVETFDDGGVLKSRGGEGAPLTMAISPGTADRAPPPPLPLWSFLVVGGGAVVTAAAGGVFTGLTLVAQSDYDQFLEGSVTGSAVDGAEVKRRAQVGETLMWTQFGLYGAAGAIALAAAVMTPFINWTGEEAIEDY